MELIKLTHENLDQEHICCAISSSKDVQVMSKKAWLKERLDEGNVIKLAAKKETAEGNGIPKEIQKELIRKKRQQKQTEAAPSEKGYRKGQRAEA